MTAKPFDYSTIPIGYYDQIFHKRAGAQSKWHHLKFKLFADSIAPHRSHLDIACGPGTFIGTLPASRLSVGVDIAADQIAYASETYGSAAKIFQHISGQPYPFQDCSFEAVTIIELLEHLPSEMARSILKESLRMLVPGGAVYVSTPNYSSLWPVMERIVNRLGGVSYEEQHITRYAPQTLQTLLESSGYEQVTCRAYQGFSFLAANLSWQLSDLLASFESKINFSKYGLLLFAKGIKPTCR
jgi:2-polyprenyl-3-methyl-5-hydroxy-6-metoxy-1,4-benzoquinol methylase